MYIIVFNIKKNNIKSAFSENSVYKWYQTLSLLTCIATWCTRIDGHLVLVLRGKEKKQKNFSCITIQ